MVGNVKATTGGQKGAKVVATADPTPSVEDQSVGDNEPVKTGTFAFSDGSKYNGEYCVTNGKVVRHGHGTFWTGNERYEGEWLHDEMHGHGVYYFATGATYDGEFQANTFYGVGNYHWVDGSYYVGGWHCNKMHGDGTYVDKGGATWRGRFVNGKCDNGQIFK